VLNLFDAMEALGFVRIRPVLFVGLRVPGPQPADGVAPVTSL
jgi:hypothetical protein